ncbi:FtsK/SpoIIIE domain-containing protein [Microbacterium sp. LRZ72]|uniref:FtsK/SpoIIIE domain-containing protein n=1 Tax=Microbacterium sp. LRZ72 TaxID=2942481 RepID=UPI0029AA71F5|nr:FtsK/SpoIIIE domain-containing protein [Microbacterium sp. LRZ72]MDX2377372.1 FtsK/SpoIIIE domain-containing protein [Microbacterium sp. LRZ72]
MTPSAEPLALPAQPEEPRRAAFPLIAMLAPVLGGIGLWVVTGSAYALWFAALGPVVAVAALLDGVRTRRRDRREGERRYTAALAALREDVATAHRHEREVLARQHPDAAALWERQGDIWRATGERASQLVVGWGSRPSRLSVGGHARGRADAEQVRSAAAMLTDVPVTVGWREGIAVHGAPLAAVPVLRALLVQLFLTHPPDRLRLVGPLPIGWEWLDVLPHRCGLGGPDGGAVTPGSASAAGDAVRLGVQGPGMVAVADGVDVVLAWNTSDSAPAPRCRHLIEVSEVPAGSLVTDESSRPVRVEAISRTQAEAAARALARRAADVYGPSDTDTGAVLGVSQLEPAVPAVDRSTLRAVIGGGTAGAVAVDLVADGPHALVAGVTGMGKSELLVTWVTALCAAHTTSQLALLLADFKGGVSFEPLRALPHVTGVITDLDAVSAARAIASLRAEMRRREAELARCGARHIGDADVELARLVVVVDEFAALAGEHAELQRVFTDIAARGRALGIHLILGTQRTSGTVRDELLANIPLRIALRVADAGESRLLVGSESAASLPGGLAGRGRAYVRRAADAVPLPFRVAVTSPADVDVVVARARDQRRPEPPWLPELPQLVTLDSLRAQAPDAEVVLGLADDPDRQRRSVVTLDREDRGLLVMGGPGSGRSSILAAIQRQCPGAAVVPRDAEQAWDMIHALRGHAPDWVLIDDVDVLLSCYPGEQAAHMAGLIDEIVRDASGRTGVVLTAQHAQGMLARVAERFARRAMLGYPSRLAHVAAGGETSDHRAHGVPGRGRIEGCEVQFALAAGTAGAAGNRPQPHPAPEWSVQAGDAVGVITRDPRRVARALRACFADGAVVVELPEEPRGRDTEAGPDAARIVVGDGDAWQAAWSTLSRLRTHGTLVIDADCPSELRVLAGHRAIAPYVHAGLGRAWWCEPGRPPRRVRLVPGAV